MNEFEDIDRELEAAFAQRPSVLSRPSLRDVKRRVRRRQRQRSAGMLSACAIVGVGGAAVLATRSPANQTTLGEGEATASTICLSTATTVSVYDSSTSPANESFLPYSNVNPVDYAVQVGDNPTSVAAMFGITLDELNAANVDTPDYELFNAGLVITVPATEVSPTTAGLQIAGEYTLQEGDFPGKVAEMFHITVAQLDAANRDVSGYGGFIVGTKIYIPEASQFVGTTTTNVGTALPQTTLFPEPTASTTTTSYPPSGDVTCVPVNVSTTTSSISTTTSSESLDVGTAIQVANCSHQEGAAGNLTNQLAERGFKVTEPDTCTIDLAVTKIIYLADDPAALATANTVARYLNNAVVEAQGAVVPTLTGTWAQASGVIVLLGDDFSGKTLAEIAAAAVSDSTVPDSTVVTT